MSNEELVESIQKQTIDNSRGMEQLYNQNKGIIHRMAKRYGSYAEMDDLLQEAYIGLYEAVRRYNENMGVKFITYAFSWIKQSITRYIENNGNIIRIPVHRHNMLSRYKKLLERYEKEYNRKPTKEEIGNILQLFPDQVEKLQKDYDRMSTKSLDALVAGGDNEKMTVADTIPSDVDIESMVLDDIIDKQFKEEFWGLISSKLDESENMVITERFKNNHTRAELSDILPQNETEPLTPNKCRAIEERALSKLRRSNLRSTLNRRFEIAITKAYHGSIWSENVMYSPTERAAFKDMHIKI